MEQFINLISIAIKYNKKNLIMRYNSKSLLLCTYLLKFNLIKNFKIKNKKIFLNLTFYRNAPIGKQITLKKKF